MATRSQKSQLSMRDSIRNARIVKSQEFKSAKAFIADIDQIMSKDLEIPMT